MAKRFKYRFYIIMMDINVDLLQWSIIFLIKKVSGGAATLANKSAVKNENMSNKKLAE